MVLFCFKTLKLNDTPEHQKLYRSPTKSLRPSFVKERLVLPTVSKQHFSGAMDPSFLVQHAMVTRNDVHRLYCWKSRPRTRGFGRCLYVSQSHRGVMNMNGYRMIMITHVFVIYVAYWYDICYQVRIMTLYTICFCVFLIIWMLIWICFKQFGLLFIQYDLVGASTTSEWWRIHGWWTEKRMIRNRQRWNGDALEVSFYFLIEMAFLVCAPLEINMEPKNHLIEKDNHLPSLHF